MPPFTATKFYGLGELLVIWKDPLRPFFFIYPRLNGFSKHGKSLTIEIGIWQNHQCFIIWISDRFTYIYIQREPSKRILHKKTRFPIHTFPIRYFDLLGALERQNFTYPENCQNPVSTMTQTQEIKQLPWQI